MPHWKANTEEMRSQGAEILSYSSQLAEIGQGIQNAGNLSELSFDGKYILQNRINNLRNTLSQQSATMRKMGLQIAEAAEIYERIEREVTEEGKERTTNFRIQNSARTGVSGSTGYSDNSGIDDEQEEDKTRDWAFDFLESIMKGADKLFHIDEAGIGADVTSYLKNLLDFFAGDKTGLGAWANLCDLCNSSSSLWSGIFGFIKSGLEGKDKSNFLSAYGQKVAGVSVLGSLFGLFGGIADFANSGSTTPGDRIADGLDVGKDGVDLVKSIYEFANFEKLSQAEGGVYTSAGLYAITAESVISTLSRLSRSISKYSDDGVWSLEDTASTGIDASIEGLETIISKLTFNLISADTFGTSTEEISQGVKDFAKNIGTGAGNYIQQHQEMREKYLNGNIFDRIGLTAEAMFKSWFS